MQKLVYICQIIYLKYQYFWDQIMILKDGHIVSHLRTNSGEVEQRTESDKSARGDPGKSGVQIAIFIT